MTDLKKRKHIPVDRAALDALVGRRIEKVEYMNVGFDRQAAVITLDDATVIVPQCDDEGNDAGALYIQTLKRHHLLGAGPYEG